MATSTTGRYTHCAKQLAKVALDRAEVDQLLVVVALVVVAQLLLLVGRLRQTTVGRVAELLQAQLKQRLRTGKSSLSRA